MPRGAGKRIALVFALALASLAAPPATADEAIIEKGDAVITGFSGVTIEQPVPETVHPLDRTFIDLDGTSAEVLDLTTLGTSPRGQVSDTRIKLKLKARDIGQVFGVALDDAETPNAYVTATSMFALQIVSTDGDGLQRLVDGGKDARWMPGQFGPGGPGAIYRIDGVSGEVSLFAKLTTDGRDNAGPALGNITFDKTTAQFFVSDLETGLIHRLSRDGEDKGTFDHGITARKTNGLDPVADDLSRRMDIKSESFRSEDPATWGYADARRRVFGLAINSGRLYYAVAEGPAVWSVSLAEDGSFGSDPRIELEPKGTTGNADITDITFDGAPVMLITQRGAITGNYDYSTFATPQQSRVLRYTWSDREGRWRATPDEYAIGLKRDHRATQGGVALGYGYDVFGNIDYGACRQTVWTTGEHLREGDDRQEIATGGSPYVTGLQGNYKARLRPANAPPEEAWFIDYDESIDADRDSFGHVGDVAISAPCQPARAGAPVAGEFDVIAPLDPPLDRPELSLHKVCHPGAIGGKIRCTIEVANISPAPLAESVEITDVTKTLYGPGAGTVVAIDAAMPLALGIVCTPAPTANFSCTVPAALLLPGNVVGIDVFIDTHDLALAGNLGFRNCARLHHPSGNLKACAEGGTDIVVEKIGPGFCLPGQTCKFGLRIINSGTMPYNGDALLADAMFVGGAVKNAAVTAVNPPIACSAGDTNQLPFTCVATLSLMPGEEQTHWIDVTMPSPGGYWAQNCFGALDPALLPLGPVPPGLSPGGGGNPSCVWVHVPKPKKNLRLTKTALDNGKCSKVGNNLHCDFEIKVTNESDVAFSGPVKIKETVPAGATISAVTAPWICNGGPPAYTCDTAAVPVNIAPGASTAFNLTVTTTPQQSEADLCKVPNTAKITVPAAGAAPNVDATDDESAAQAMTLGIFWQDPLSGVTFIMCDPTNLKVEKIAKGPCEAKSGAFACAYEVSITNMGPDPFEGPVKLDEKFGRAPASVSFNGDLTCAGAGADYTCATAGIVQLAKGERLKLDVTAIVGGDACTLPNTATMTSPPAGSKGNGKGDDDQASVSADVPARRCGDTTTIIPPPRCPDGKPLPRSGRCPCGPDQHWSRSANRCIDDGGDPVDDCRADGGIWRRDRCIFPPDECPLGTVGRYPDCLPIVPPVVNVCPPGTIGKFPRCRKVPKVCPPGTVGRFPKCRDVPKVCPPGTVGKPPRCRKPPSVCPPGTKGRYPKCKPIAKQCPPGTVGRFPKCRKPPVKCPRGLQGTPPNCYPKKLKPPKFKFNPGFNKPPRIGPRNPGLGNGGGPRRIPGGGGGGFGGIIKKF